jgi:hypothetical protein
MIRFILFLLLFTNIIYSKEFTITCTAVIGGERTCFIEGTADGRITFTIPCDCEVEPCVDQIFDEDMDDPFDFEEPEEYEEVISPDSIHITLNK